MSKTSNKGDTISYMAKARGSHKRVDWRDYVIPTKNKKKRKISEMVDKIVYGA